jgi:hypothetical protein
LGSTSQKTAPMESRGPGQNLSFYIYRVTSICNQTSYGPYLEPSNNPLSRCSWLTLPTRRLVDYQMLRLRNCHVDRNFDFDTCVMCLCIMRIVLSLTSHYISRRPIIILACHAGLAVSWIGARRAPSRLL